MEPVPPEAGPRSIDFLVAPRGDLNTAEECRPVDQQLQALLAAGGRVIVVDATHIEHVSGTGLRLLLQAARRLRRLQGELFLFGVSPTVRKVLSLSTLDSEFTIADDGPQACALARQHLVEHLAATAARTQGPPEATPPEAVPPPEAAPPPEAPTPPPAAAHGPEVAPEATEVVPSRLNLTAVLVLQALGASDTTPASRLPLPAGRQATLDEMAKRIENVCAGRRA